MPLTLILLGWLELLALVSFGVILESEFVLEESTYRDCLLELQGKSSFILSADLSCISECVFDASANTRSVPIDSS
jgi:hypothetical protein